ncbi:hypothetical protein BGW41_000214 [Actinomortierella wolfii]|nr:hypothetical protein BGW41_000214 [Actinomortierella wolfii]
MGNLPSRHFKISNDDMNTADSATSVGCITFGAESVATSANTTPSPPESDSHSAPSILRTSTTPSNSDAIDDLEHLYGPAQLDPAYLASIFPALASSVTTSSFVTTEDEAGPQQFSLTNSVVNSLVSTPVSAGDLPQSTHVTSSWSSSSSSDNRIKGNKWRQPKKKLKDRETEAQPSPQPEHQRDNDSDMELTEEGQEGSDIQDHQHRQPTVAKTGFYQKQDHLRMLEMPEIISCIFEFLDKPSLASASRVNRHWRTYCTPIMWRHVVDRNWRHRTFCSLIANKAHWVRSIHCEMSTDYDQLLACKMEHLNTISFRGNHDSMDTKMAIVRNAAKTLTSLSLSGVASTLDTDVARVIHDLQRLSVLKITRTTITRSFLQMVFDGCRDLEFLSLRGITFELDTDSSRQPSSRNLLKNQPLTRVLYLNLRSVQLVDDDLVEIIEACPELRELSIAGNSSLKDFTRLAKCLRQSCPDLYALDIASCVEIVDDHFTALWSVLGPQLKIVNLAGTKLSDKELALLARECRSLTRLDIQYCTSISTKGLHEFMCTVSPTLQQLEASGITIDPEEIDDREWVCSGLKILVIHINLFDRRRLCPDIPQDQVQELGFSSSSTNSTTLTPAEITAMTALRDVGASAAASVETDIVDDPDQLFQISGSSDGSSTISLRLDEDIVMESPPKDDVSEHGFFGSSINCNMDNNSNRSSNKGCHGHSKTKEAQQEVKSISTTDNMLQERQRYWEETETIWSVKTDQSSEAASEPRCRRHLYHPIQRLRKLHYLGLMGVGAAKLTESSVGEFIHAFDQVDHLDLSGLSHAFKQEDLTWLIESLPNLFQIDAEHYHISDDLRKWCRKEYPEVTILRKGH